jgi:hypothetical protein
MSDYSDKLKDPRWQKLRLQVFERDKFTCQCCQDTEETLTVHHLEYAKSGDPWDVPIESLLTLCDNCHSECEKILRKLRRVIPFGYGKSKHLLTCASYILENYSHGEGQVRFKEALIDLVYRCTWDHHTRDLVMVESALLQSFVAASFEAGIDTNKKLGTPEASNAS